MKDIYLDYIEALKEAPTPAVILNMDFLEQNIDWALEAAGQKNIRLATKSLRSLSIIKHIQKKNSRFQGLMCFTLSEALWLRDQGMKDLLMGYPTMDHHHLSKLAKNPADIILMVDLVDHLEFLNAIAKKENSVFEICVDIDLSMDLPKLRFGVYRSSIQTLSQLEAFLNKLKVCSHLKLVGLMGYEAQIAGVTDLHSPLIRTLKSISIPKLQTRRESMVKMIQEAGHELRFINGGGTGSLSSTSTEAVVTEVTVGSGLYAPHLFDGYQDFKLKPAMCFSLQIVRNPAQGIYTALGGGYIASGTQEPSKIPKPFLPEGMKLLKHEAAGEVQTPFKSKFKMKLGDLIFFRHAKAGEICERFNEIHLLRKNKIIQVVKTYRGEGQAFL